MPRGQAPFHSHKTAHRTTRNAHNTGKFDDYTSWVSLF